jgi:hypothetical protein
MTNTPKDAMKAEWTYSAGILGFTVFNPKGDSRFYELVESSAKEICDKFNQLDQLLTAEMPERSDELMTYAEWLESPMSNDLSAHAYRDAYADYIREYRKSIAHLQSENERLKKVIQSAMDNINEGNDTLAFVQLEALLTHPK